MMVSQETLPKKGVIMVMLDTLMDKPFQQALEQEDLSVLPYFMDRGEYYPRVVAPYPTMSVNVESTLLTGHYPDQHRVPALAWFNQKENRLINYGTHVLEMRKLGLSTCLYDSFYRLNQEHLSSDVKTIHEELADQGLTSASINPLMHKGNVPTTITVPSLIRLFVSLEKNIEISAADKFVYGRLANLSPLKKYSRLWNKYGFNNKFSIQEFSHLVKNDTIPDFSFVYLPDHDKNVHKRGPMDTKGIKDMDKQLKPLMDAFPSWEEALKNYIWIIIGDNGQSGVQKDKNKALVDIRKLLQPLKITKLRKGVQNDDQVVVASNLRSCFIYTLKPDEVPVTEIAEKLQTDSRVEMAAWKSEGWIHVIKGECNETFTFKEGGSMKDEYKQTWEIDGDHSLLDLSITENVIEFGDYPDALKRLHSALHSHEGEFVVTSVKPGHEFISESTPKHPNGASHGGFHKNDSFIPMLVTGTDAAPDFLRIVDLKKWILNLIQSA
ncbi:alkaline phosphatase family protein [Salsuginibacillus kocurii]|uniref:alkaline phosphatase family protein n=1 Tax=Salsuginibacillus kocurii TaxID=427078 RepID=UPI00146B9FF5|nr:alkaline phosphatase family protein [Salsuginibacillus kocurii]